MLELYVRRLPFSLFVVQDISRQKLTSVMALNTTLCYCCRLYPSYPASGCSSRTAAPAQQRLAMLTAPRLVVRWRVRNPYKYKLSDRLMMLRFPRLAFWSLSPLALRVYQGEDPATR